MRNFARRVVGLGLTATAFSSMAIGSANAQTKAASADSWASGWTSVPLFSGTAIASGVLMNGAVPAAGATAVLFVQPRHSAMVPGTTQQMNALTRATTDGTGHWSLGVPSGTDLSTYASAHGDINLEIRTFDSVGSDMYFLPVNANSTVATPGRTAAAPMPKAIVNSSPVTLTTDPAIAHNITLNSEHFPNASATPQQSDRRSARSSTIGVVQPNICSTSGGTITNNVSAQTGYTSNLGPGASMTFTYAKGSTSTLGIGVSSSGAAGSWSASGAITQSSTGSQTYGVDGAGNRTLFISLFQSL